MAFVTGVVTRFIGAQMGAGVNLWTGYRNLKTAGLIAPYTAFADSWAKLYRQRAFSSALKTTWFTGRVPRRLISEVVLKQPYKYKYTYTMRLTDRETGVVRTERMSLYSNHYMSREEAIEDIISKQAASKEEYGGKKYTFRNAELDLVEHNQAMEW